MSMSTPASSARPAAQAIARAARRLSDAAIARARAEAQSIVRHATGLSEEELLLHPEAALSPAQIACIDELVSRRAAREPLPYVLGWAEFYSRRFRVSPAAIVPRPETEILAEAAIARARAARAGLIADVGTGSGSLAVTLASELPAVRVVATDISTPALRLAAENARLHQVAEKVHLVCCDLLSGVGRPVECVVANLPYIASDDFAALEPEVREFEPRIALNGGSDGLGLIRRLSVQLSHHLNKGGFAALEVGAGQASAVAKLLERAGLGEIEVVADYGGIDRVVIGWRRG